jgi:hypothetical protein
VRYHRERLLEKFVKDGESWSKARRGYQATLSMQARMVSMMANWVGGAHVYRHRKGDPDALPPVEVVAPDAQRAALQFVIENALRDQAYGLSPELIVHMTVDKWSDNSPGDRGDPTWPVHARVAALQGAALTMVLNPTTLTRVHDNELRTPADQDALTLPELMQTLVDEVFSELHADLSEQTFTDRKPMISSLRRDLQSGAVDRLIALAEGDGRMPRPIRTIATEHLRTLQGKLEAIGGQVASGRSIDFYTLAHLKDLADRISKTLDRIYVGNG